MTPEFPATVPENVEIRLADGLTIAASLVTPPEGDGPWPVLISFYPYRKDDFMGAGVAYARDVFAADGFASLLVDIRGYGSSSGRAYQAWDPREFDDAAEVVEWAAAQAWCDGRTGVWGSSYGGAQALGVATRRPPSLKAIASVYGAADIYEDFVFPGGCPNGLGASAWGALVVAKELAPPSLPDAEGRWLDAWRDRLGRLEADQISSMVWPSHPTYDDYWRTRRIPVEDIAVPSFFVSGWRDLLCKGMMDAYDRCVAPKQLLVGPWTHAAPDVSAEAPYDWLAALSRWFRRWMTDSPAQAAEAPVVYYVQGAREWRTADQWPPAEVASARRHPAPGGALGDTVTAVSDLHVTDSLTGPEAGLWYPMGLTLGGAFEQTRDDDLSLTYTSAPLDADTDIAGAPFAEVNVRVADGLEAHLCLKLCAVDSAGRSSLITSGWLHLPAAPEAERSVKVDLYPTAYRIPAGHRLRWTVSGADFPRLWPTAAAPTLTISSAPGAPSQVTLPLCDPTVNAARAFTPDLPPTGVNRSPWALRGEPRCIITRDEARRGIVVTAGVDMTLRLPQGGTFRLDHSITAEMEAAKPAAAAMRTRATVELEMATGEPIRVETRGYAVRGRRHLWGKVTAGGEVIYERRWSTFNGRPA
ncbi:MAG: hypothetical protein DI570_06160 [Phenylobacterium zucineum]|nr:MAG: hypothetical protein DI570_06160 [Phenylobacterium zucineum]